MTAFTLIAELRAKPGAAADLASRLLALVEPSRAETGCLEYRLHASQTDPDHFLIVERWISDQALDAHFAEPYLVDFVASQAEVLDGPIMMRFFEALDAAQTARRDGKLRTA